jgi:hypothetical protein
VSKLGECVPSATQVHFKEMCRQLVDTENVAVFGRIVEMMRSEWPKLKGWLDWWLAPEHASMIFASQRTMDQALAAKLPATTNPEESIHAVIYNMAGDYIYHLIIHDIN